ncbi:MAG: hypothetical protein Q4G09_00190 [Clostridia bacterium]|nr:hypothetical protein [Clostridia bacterium]
MDFNTCKRILQIDYSKITDLSKLQEYKTKLIDAYRYINEHEDLCLTRESIEKGFIKCIPEISIDSFVPTDNFMTQNIRDALGKINQIFIETYKREIPEFRSNFYKNIYYCVINDCNENEGGYYIELYKINDNKEINFNEILDYLVIHKDIDWEMQNPRQIVEKHIDELIENKINNEEELENE